MWSITAPVPRSHMGSIIIMSSMMITVNSIPDFVLIFLE